MSEAEVMRDKALRVLRAAVEEARGEPGTYVSRARVMEQTNITDLGEFSRIAHYLAGRGLIAEGVNDYEFFVLTLGGIAAGAKY
jgi:hypothetical protein